jgi:eukaryotic-like serine/threonine-protein kinase
VIGKTVSHYEVLYRLGRGGMGEVYAARDTFLGRMVAIKVLRMADVASVDDQLRFLQEARAASALNHPGIVTIHDVVRDGDADCIIMELVGGETLAARIGRGAVPLTETLEVADRIADALAMAHGQGIVHRDLKPANVMLTSAGGVKILDFGLAKIVATGEADVRHATLPRTQSGLVVGTPSYMSPEQALGRPLDGRSDLFSLGTIAMEMLTGSNPFEADSAVATMHRIVYGDPTAEVLQKVPASARGLVAKALAKEKDQRFQSADELRAAIATVRSGTRFDGPRDTARRATRRRIAIATAAAVLLAGIGIGASQIWRPRAIASPPAPAPVRAQSYTPPRTAQDHLRQGNELLSTYWRKGYIDQAIEAFQRAIGLDAQNAAAHAGLSAAYWRKYDVEDDRAWLDLAVKNATHAVELDTQLTAAHVALAVAELSRGRIDVARKELEQALLTDPGNAAAHRWLGEVASRAKDDVTAEAELRKALALRPQDVELHNALGTFLYNAARYDEAAATFRGAVALSPDNASSYRNLGAVLHMRGDYAGAARALQESLEIEPSGIVYSNLGTLYFFQGLYPQSVTAFEKAVQLGANNHLMWANLGDAYRWTPGNQAKAREAFDTALHLIGDELRKHPRDATLQSLRALYLAKRGDKRNALDAADALIARETNPQNLYFLALTFELSGARQKSVTALASAIRNGYSVEEVKTDPELASLRRDVQFQRMMVAVR